MSSELNFEMSKAPKISQDLTLKISSENLFEFSNGNIFNTSKIKNIEIFLERLTKIKKLKTILEKYKNSVENLELRNFNANNFTDIKDIFISFSKIKSLNLVNCSIENLNDEAIEIYSTLRSIKLQKCNANIFKALRNQNSLTKITIINHDKTWNGFYHEGLNEILKHSKNLTHVVLAGDGTTSYFDLDGYPFKIEKLETTVISHHWYVGLKNKRIKFLESQKGSLKELTIHQLPFDFDGGDVLKYIFEEMELETFYYGKTPLILNGQKQEVKEFEASEIQVTSICEMFRQFKTIEKLTLNLNTTDVSSEDIENIINPPSNLFKSLKIVKVNDKSRKGTLGLFLSLFKKFINIKVLEIDSNDRCLGIILQECLPQMTILEKVHLSSTTTKAFETINQINKLNSKIRNFSISLPAGDGEKNI